MTKEFNPVFLNLSIIDMDDILRTPYLEETCRALSFGPGYGMTRSLDHYKELVKQRSVDASGIIAFYQGKPLGWLLYTYETDQMSFKRYGSGHKDSEAAAHIFVDEGWRRFGIGTRLLHLAAKMADPDTLRVYAHENQPFFQPIIKQFDSVQAI